MANNITVNENRMRLQQMLSNPYAIEFWASQFGSALRVKCDDFFMRFAFLDAEQVPQKFKDFTLEEKKIFVEVCAKRQDDDGSGDITPIELKLFFDDMTDDKFFVNKLHLLVAKEKYKRHFSLDKCQEYCDKLLNLMKENGIEIVKEVKVEPEAVKKVAIALNLVPTGTEGLPEQTLDESDGKYVGQVQNGKAHGFGVKTFNSGNKFIGYHNNGQKSGIAFYDYGKAGRYFGHQKLNLRCGLGLQQWNNSNQKYIGCWKADKKDGLCIYEWQNAQGLMTWYAGYYKMDQRSGFG